MTTQGQSIVVACGACGQRNRVALESPPDAARCGRCASTLGLGRVTPVTDASFAREIEASSLPVLLDCWAAWCGPCRMVAPVLEELARELPFRMKFAKLDVDANPAIAARHGISSIPTMLLFRDGDLAGRIVGAQPKSSILGELRRVGFV